jgi:Cytosol aminopeptidase family, N-terminal domain.
MKSKFSVSKQLRAGSEQGVEQVETPLLMIAKFAGANNSGFDLSALVSQGTFSDEKLKDRGFRGNLGEQLTLTLGEDSAPKKVLFIGLGKSGSFNCATIRDIIKVAVNRAVALKADKLSIPIFPNRMTSASLPLRGTAHIIRCVADDVLATKKGDATLEIEIVCTPQAARHVEAGLDCKRRGKACGSCDSRPQDKAPTRAKAKTN